VRFLFFLLVAATACADFAGLAPDGLIYASNRSNSFQIWQTDLNQDAQLTHLEGDIAWAPRLSPHGDVLVYYRSAKGAGPNNFESCELWRHSLISHHDRALIPRRKYGWKAHSGAQWSPDGKSLVMAAKTTKEDAWQLFVTDGEGNYPRKLTRGERQFHDPCWSPDGRQIAYVAFPKGYEGIDPRRFEIHIANASGKDEVRVTYDALRDHHPAWSPDGTLIAYESQINKTVGTNGSWAIRVIGTDGTGNRSIVEDAHFNSSPRWSVDGSVVFFHRSRNVNADEVHIWGIGQDGSRLRRVIYSNAYSNMMVDIVTPQAGESEEEYVWPKTTVPVEKRELAELSKVLSEEDAAEQLVAESAIPAAVVQEPTELPDIDEPALAAVPVVQAMPEMQELIPEPEPVPEPIRKFERIEKGKEVPEPEPVPVPKLQATPIETPSAPAIQDAELEQMLEQALDGTLEGDFPDEPEGSHPKVD